MKLCYVATDVVIPHFRGASTHVYELSKNLVRIGHEVHTVSRRLSASQPEYEKLDGIDVHRVHRGIFFSPPSSSYSQLKEYRGLGPFSKLYEIYLLTLHALYAGIYAANIVKRNKLDVILERETSFGAGAIASFLTERPMVLEVIGPRISKLSLLRARRILAYTELMVPDESMRRKLVLVTSAVDPELFRTDTGSREAIRAKYKLGTSIVIGYIGTFQPWHGVEDLVYASKEILKTYPELRFLMVGPYYRPVESLVKKLGVANAYVFTGPVPYSEVPKYINAADILVALYNPAKSELRMRYGIGSPLKVMEYMSCAKPLIASSVRPIIDIIKDGVNGLLVPPGDVNSIENALIRLIENKALAEVLGERARMCVLQGYSWEALARQFEFILSEVVHEHRSEGGVKKRV